MPIKIPADLPARKILEREGVMVMDEETAIRQDIRPMRVALLNLMPEKWKTETQFARLVGATPLQIEMTLVRMSDHASKTTSPAHIARFYRPFTDIREEKFDGLIVTGAPVEKLPFEEVDYWRELQGVFDWAKTHVHSTFAVCWGAQAMIRHLHGAPKHPLREKAFGVFRHQVRAPASPYLRGFSDDLAIPVSRWTETRREDIPPEAGLEILIDSAATGPCLVADAPNRALYMFNHIEYDTTTLADEHARDRAPNGQTPPPPSDYYPGDDPQRPPVNVWRSHAHLLFGNWINEVYQTCPFDTARIGEP